MRSKTTLTALALACTAAVCGGALVAAGERSTPQFFSDDPVRVDYDTRLDATGAARAELGRYADFVLNSFRSPGDQRAMPALNVNTMGEVPDSSWFTNRIGTVPMSIDDIARGPDRVERLDVEDWVIVEGKDSGQQPGFRAVSASDSTGHVFQIEFDSLTNPEMATGAEVIGTAIYHAIGYNVVETYVIDLDISKLSIAPTATISSSGRKRAFTRRDLDAILRGAAKTANGHYRASASRFAEGRYIGPFRYYGTRPDDPNDIYPHEHRRELRGNRVFSAWLNHDDSRAGNSLDMLVRKDGRQSVKHYMFDFGSILGSGTGEEDHAWVGREYVVEPKPGLLTLASLGLWRRPYLSVDAPSRLPAAGNFTADRFDPETWKPHYPNQAFRHMQAEDAFWAARIVSAFSRESIAQIVAKARFSDPRVTDHVTGALLRRRELVLRSWLTALNPIANPRIGQDGVLRFDNLAADAEVVDASSDFEVSWFRFDNETGVRVPVTGARVFGEPAVTLPLQALQGAGYAGVEVRTLHDSYPQWRIPVRFYFRHAGGAWSSVGVERNVNASADDVRYAGR